MSNDNEELKKQIEKLNQELEDVKKQLKENTEADERRHQEIKEVQTQDVFWNKFSSIGTPSAIALIGGLVVKFLSKDKKDKQKELSDNSSPVAPAFQNNLAGILEIIREAKKKD